MTWLTDPSKALRVKSDCGDRKLKQSPRLQMRSRDRFKNVVSIELHALALPKKNLRIGIYFPMQRHRHRFVFAKMFLCKEQV